MSKSSATRDVTHGQPLLRQQFRRHRQTHPLQYRLEGGAFLRQPTVQRLSTHREHLPHPHDAHTAGDEERAHRKLHLPSRGALDVQR